MECKEQPCASYAVPKVEQSLVVGARDCVEEERATMLHLLAQVAFLHAEVDRLEGQLAATRADANRQIHIANSQMEAALDEQAGEVRSLKERLRSTSGRKSKWEEGEDLFSRCRLLEVQLATVLSEKTTLTAEKHDLLAKVRRLDATARERKREIEKAAHQLEVVCVAHRQEMAKLHKDVEALASEREEVAVETEMMRQKIRQFESDFKFMGVAGSDPREQETRGGTLECHDAESQTELCLLASGTDQGCQVGLVCGHHGEIGQSIQSVTHMFEVKCSELDDLRAAFENVSSNLSEALAELSLAKQQIAEESQKRKLTLDDVERLSLQVRALQQRASQQSAVERDLRVKLEASEQKRTELSATVIKVEQERREWEEVIAAHRQDLDCLVSNQNFTSNQVQKLTDENDTLRASVETLLQREAQLHYALKSKDVELQELISAYRHSAKESEEYEAALRGAERGEEAMRAELAAKEERTIFLQDQLEQMHIRERQQTLDLQSMEHENGKLNHKAIQAEAQIAQLETQLIELLSCVHAKERVCDELQQSIATLSSQIVVKDNENMLLRHRCETVEHDYALLHSTHQTESHRLRQLEENNARLVVRDVMSRQLAGESDTLTVTQLQGETEHLKEALEQAVNSLQEVSKSLSICQQDRKRLEKLVDEKEAAVTEAVEARKHLQKQLEIRMTGSQ